MGTSTMMMMMMMIIIILSVVSCDLDRLNAETSCYVDGMSDEVQSKADALARILSQQRMTDRRRLQCIFRHFVPSQVNRPQRLYVLLTDKLNS